MADPQQATRAGLAEQDLVNAIPVALLGIGGDDTVILANMAAEALLDRARNALIARRWTELFDNPDVLQTVIDRVRNGRRLVIRREAHLRLRQGEMQVDLRAAPLGEDGADVLLMIEAVNLPGIIRHQGDFHGAARSAFGLAAMLAHEIKNPLAGIRGAAQLLEKAESTKGRAMARLIRDEVDRIRGLVDELEAFSDSRPLSRRPVNIHKVLDHVMSLVTRETDAPEIRCRFDPSLPPVLGDRDRLVQIFLNLVQNAAAATRGADGHILLRTAYRHGLRLTDGSGEQTSLPIEVTVADTGPGVPADIVEHVFDPFVTGREGGSGLGLAMVAKLVAGHGGLVELENTPDGAVFRVLLPAADGRGGEEGTEDG